ncbi:MAG: LacI family DNA-binding transcriptional regulator [Lentisphaerota bacterium]
MSRRSQTVNIYKIAEEAGVSAATVSRVINRRLGVGEKTRKRISDLVRGYNFTPDYPAVRTVRIAVISPASDLTEYICEAMKGVYAYANPNELMVNIIIANAPRKESLRETIRDQQCSGVIAIAPGGYMKELYTLGDTDLPVVIIDDQIDDPKIGFIDNDSYSGSVEATRYLLGLGHRRIGYLRHYDPNLDQLQRFKGYENTMKAAGAAIEKNWVLSVLPDPANEIWAMPGLLTMRRLLDQAPELTAVIAVDDSLALGAMTAIHERGLRIPEDISVLGFDNYPETQVWYPALTTVDHAIEKAGYMAIEAIHAGLLNPGQWIPPREILPTSLVIRKSTGPAKNKV